VQIRDPPSKEVGGLPLPSTRRLGARRPSLAQIVVQAAAFDHLLTLLEV